MHEKVHGKIKIWLERPQLEAGIPGIMVQVKLMSIDCLLTRMLFSGPLEAWLRSVRSPDRVWSGSKACRVQRLPRQGVVWWLVCCRGEHARKLHALHAVR